MNEFKGTKSKWEIKKGDKTTFTKIIIDKNKIIVFGYKTKDWETELYDALLISKSPEMLEMLKSVYDLQKNNYGDATDTHIAMITKAKEIEQLIKEATEL